VLGVAMIALLAVLIALDLWLYATLGSRLLLWAALAVFVAAWIGQFVGHALEGHRPSFLTDLSYLLVGPLWLMAKALRRSGLTW
jgi:uncharacterized membrane protein YGL010W